MAAHLGQINDLSRLRRFVVMFQKYGVALTRTWEIKSYRQQGLTYHKSCKQPEVIRPVTAPLSVVIFN
jgi:hypothetical protein